ncbi:MAG: DNA-directed RNA polymerase subunit D [Candidatus Brockarchaeota archaeon]|nr:DNA-directed RNA polymerase subunit D [Candidatus Brockarchaeota archaeon]
MELSVISSKEDDIVFRISGVTPAFVNSLRRTILCDVPILAIHEVMFFENESPMHDEIVAHRLGLIPLTTPPGKYVSPELCDCGSELGCAKCRVSLLLDVTGTENRSTTVYSSDLKSEDPEVQPVSAKIPITKLGPKKRLKLEAYARLGVGSAHAKWQPAATVSYKFQPKVTVSQGCDACGRCVAACPQKILKVQGGRLYVSDVDLCTVCKECARACPKTPAAIVPETVRDEFIFFLHSTGSLPPAEIMRQAARILEEKAGKVCKAVGG